MIIVLSSGLSVANPLLIRAIFDHALFPPGGRSNIHLLLELVAVMVAVAAAATAPASCRPTWRPGSDRT